LTDKIRKQKEKTRPRAPLCALEVQSSLLSAESEGKHKPSHPALRGLTWLVDLHFVDEDSRIPGGDTGSEWSVTLRIFLLILCEHFHYGKVSDSIVAAGELVNELVSV